MAFRSELTNTFIGARLGQSRLFVRGGRRRALLPGESYSYLGRTDITPPQITRGDKTTFEMPSDTDGTTTILVEAAPGAHETNTGTITQRLESTMGEGWWDAIRDNAPVTMFIPAGRVRQLDEIDDWESGWLVDNVYLKNLGPDNNANPADRATVGEAFNLTGEFEYESYAVHRVLPVSFSEETAGAIDSSNGNTTLDIVNAVGFRRGADGINYVAGSAATAAAGTSRVVATAGKIRATDLDGEWQDGISLTDAAYGVDDLAVVGSNIVAIDTANDAHHVVRVDDVVKGSGTVTPVTNGYESTKGPKAIYARSAGNMIIVGVDGYIYRAGSLRGGVEVVDAGTIVSEDLNDVHGFATQVVAVGGDGSTAKVIAVSEDSGASWESVTVPATVDASINCVYMVEQDSFIIGLSNGKVFYTNNLGRTFKEGSLTGFSPTAINDIQMVENETGISAIGYMAATNGTSNGKVARTIDGGQTWNFIDPYADTPGADLDTPTVISVTSVAAVDSNRAVAGGLKIAADATTSSEAAQAGTVLATSQA